MNVKNNAKSLKDYNKVDSPIQSYLESLHLKYSNLHDGEVATYIPELSKADPNWFGISIATTDGYVYEVGDSRQTFTIQSTSKPFIYGVALEDRGIDYVLSKIGVEPTGDAFNSISLAPETGCPLNPMINAGAIAATSLVLGDSSEDKMERILKVFSAYAGRGLSIDTSVYESEKETGHRNRAIGHMLRNFDIISEHPDISLDLYFKQCSISVDSRDLSLMAATLANGGINPLTKERAVSSHYLENIMSIMTMCGMYDYAGEWMYWIGIPAKSGVAGGILAVMPGQVGIGIFSPRLDQRGNSVRGIEVCKDFSRDFNLHSLRAPRSSRSTIRANYDISKVRSKRLRSESDDEILDRYGNKVKVYELQGDLVFSTAELVIRNIVNVSETTDIVILDFRRITNIEDSSSNMLLELIKNYGKNGKNIILVNLQQRHSKFRRFLEEELTKEGNERSWLYLFNDMDICIEWCENRLIDVENSGKSSDEYVTLAEHDLCRGFDSDSLSTLERLLNVRNYKSGELIVRKGEPADEIYLLMSGKVSVRFDLPNGRIKRLSTLTPGMVFGEIAVINRSARSADVHADKNVECFTLSKVVFEELSETHPKIKITLLQNMVLNFSRMLNMAEREITTLSW